MRFGDKVKMKNLYFTSDTHFLHENIVLYSSRPFLNARDMDDQLITLINDTVPSDGLLFHLGDFAFSGNISIIKSLTERINCDIHLIMGNHDYQSKFYRESISKLFASVHDYLFIRVEDDETQKHQGLFLCHYPMATWHDAVRGSWNLHGHIHSGPNSTATERDVASNIRQYDVGVDNNMYRPISYERVKEIIEERINN